MKNSSIAAWREQLGARRARLPVDVAIDIAAALGTVPRDKRAAFVEIVARELGVTPGWVYLRTQPFRRRQRAFDSATIAAALGAVRHGARVALVDKMAREHGVSRATVYRWIQRFRRRPRGRVNAQSAAEAARDAARAAALVINSAKGRT